MELERQLAAYTRQTATGSGWSGSTPTRPPARLVASTEARRGPDVVLMPHNWPHLYRDSLADVGDLCEWKTRDQDGYYPAAAAAARAGSRWLALPYGVVPFLVADRRPWFADVGALAPPQTLDEYDRSGPGSSGGAAPSAIPSATRSAPPPPGPARSSGPSGAPRSTRAAAGSCSTPAPRSSP